MIMKNLIRKMLLVMCVAALALAFTACGKSDKPAPKAVEKEEPAEDEAEEPEEEWHYRSIEEQLAEVGMSMRDFL